MRGLKKKRWRRFTNTPEKALLVFCWYCTISRYKGQNSQSQKWTSLSTASTDPACHPAGNQQTLKKISPPEPFPSGGTEALWRPLPRHCDLWSQASAPPDSLWKTSPVMLSLLICHTEHNQYQERWSEKKTDRDRKVRAGLTTILILNPVSLARHDGYVCSLCSVLPSKVLRAQKNPQIDQIN